ncbi:aminotransferase [Cellulomonas marina]|uniref:cysteine-S-conjugate beta-lyase n=1 Tax=Cellulomonas marina TaxID=988821 RepID=A0A1I0Y8T0_9CELL|nr:aminotransferase class I/II-fold pyridoxal phosphate-dependent enzyme [Cellulomonas marina]GIG29810.1 aminotransferase [Cellulomonas marina]SFB08563.1 cystathione beta-lyase [Cellulomonas marina]
MDRPDLDAITADELRERGSLKWTTFPGTIGAFVAEMDFGLAPEVSQALHASLDRAVTGYLPPALADGLATATADWYADSFGLRVPDAWVHHVPDVLAAFELTMDHFTAPGSAVIVPTPACMPFLEVPELHGREVVQVPSVERDGRLHIDLDAVERAFADGAGLFVLCNPHNPLGTVYRREELEALAEVVGRAGGRVFSDEIHAPIVYGEGRHVPYASVSPAAAAHTVTAVSASKAWNLAGLKCAQVILTNEADEAHWQTFGFMAGHGTANLGVIGNTAAYTAGRRWLDGVVDYLDGNRRLLAELVAEHLPGVRVTVPEGTYIAWMDFRATALTGDLGEWYREHAGVAMTDGLACGAVGAGHTRFVFALPRPLLRECSAVNTCPLPGRTAMPCTLRCPVCTTRGDASGSPRNGLVGHASPVAGSTRRSFPAVVARSCGFVPTALSPVPTSSAPAGSNRRRHPP